MARRLMVAVVCCAAVTLGGELAARGIDGDLPRVLEWHSAEAEHKVAQVEYLADEVGVDVVFFGSSLTNAGLDPLTFMQAADEAGADPLVAYNAGLSAGMPLVTERWARDVVAARLDPELVVIGVSSFDFTDHPSVDVFYDAFATSPAGRRAVGEEGVLDRLDRFLDERSTLWRNKAALRDPRTVLNAIRGNGPAVDPTIAAIGDLGRTTFRETQRFEDRAPDVGIPVSDWTPGERNPAALRRLVEDLQGDGADVVLLDMPVTDEYIADHRRGATDQATYLDALRALGEATGAPVLEHSDLRDHALFADEVHLNVDGATLLTTTVAQEIAQLGLLPS